MTLCKVNIKKMKCIFCKTEVPSMYRAILGTSWVGQPACVDCYDKLHLEHPKATIVWVTLLPRCLACMSSKHLFERVQDKTYWCHECIKKGKVWNERVDLTKGNPFLTPASKAF